MQKMSFKNFTSGHGYPRGESYKRGKFITNARKLGVSSTWTSRQDYP